MPQVAAITFHLDEVPEVRVRRLPFDQRVEVLVRFPQQRRAVVLFGDGESIVAGLRCVATEVETLLEAGETITLDDTDSGGEAPAEAAAEVEPA